MGLVSYLWLIAILVILPIAGTLGLKLKSPSNHNNIDYRKYYLVLLVATAVSAAFVILEAKQS